MRQLTPTLFDELKNEKSELHALLEYVKADDTLDMEFRGNSFTLYYRGGALLTVEEISSDSYNWNGITGEYLLAGKDRYEQKHKDAEQFDEYIPEAKHIIDRYICLGAKNHLGEKEIQQLVVKENNYSPNSQDTDYFIVDMEYEESNDSGRFDLVVLRWDSSTSARKSNNVSMAIVEVKQGIDTVRTSESNPGLKQHQNDFEKFCSNPTAKKSFMNDMLTVFKQKCELGLIKANSKIENITEETKLQLVGDLEFYCLLANYKPASKQLKNELEEMDDCKFFTSSYMGYGLYVKNIIDKEEILKTL